MPEPIEDLWGQDFPEDHEDSAPAVLMKQQGQVLKRKTAGRIEGEVRQSAEGGTAWTSLYARVPGLGGYLFKLAAYSHPVHADPPPLKAYHVLEDQEQDIADME